MQALVAPIAAAAGGMAPLTTLIGAGSAVASGVSAYAAGKADEEANRINAYIGRTRAMQTDATARENLDTELGTLRATFAANGQRPTVGTAEIFNELRRVRSRDRRIEFGNRMQEASAYNIAANNARSSARAGLWGGMAKAAPSVMDYLEMRAKRG